MSTMRISCPCMLWRPADIPNLFQWEILFLAIQQLAMQPPAVHPNWIQWRMMFLGSPEANGVPTSLLGSVGQLGQLRNNLANLDGVKIILYTHSFLCLPGHFDRAIVICQFHSFPCQGIKVFWQRTMASFCHS